MSEVAGPRSLRELLDAVLAPGSDLDFPSMLRRLVESAVSLVDARYGALGVLDETGTRLARFITVGIDDDVHRLIGTLPEGHGILGLLILDAEVLRLPDLREHPDSTSARTSWPRCGRRSPTSPATPRRPRWTSMWRSPIRWCCGSSTTASGRPPGGHRAGTA